MHMSHYFMRKNSIIKLMHRVAHNYDGCENNHVTSTASVPNNGGTIVTTLYEDLDSIDHTHALGWKTLKYYFTFAGIFVNSNDSRCYISHANNFLL